MEKFIEIDRKIKEAKVRLGNPSKIWYRGHENVDYKLLPSLLRYSNGLEKEQLLFERFKQFTQKAGESPSSWETLFNMQHFGVPTRLLDWTEVLGVALFFLTRNSTSNDSTLWMLDPFKLNSKGIYKDNLPLLPPNRHEEFDYYEKYIKNVSPDNPIALYGDYVNNRMLAQKGCFTIHGNNTTSLEETFSDCIARIDIPASFKTDIIKFLEYSDINEFSIFPDIGGLAPFLKSIVGLEMVQENLENHTKLIKSLTIESAIYGTDRKNTDVTGILKSKIGSNGELDIIANNDLFGDPCVGYLKKLSVTYIDNKGTRISTVVSEHGRLRIP
jgi:hypothetical protein